MAIVEQLKVYKIRVGGKGYANVTIPTKIKNQLNLRTGDHVMWIVHDDGTVELKKVTFTH